MINFVAVVNFNNASWKIACNCDCTQIHFCPKKPIWGSYFKIYSTLILILCIKNMFWPAKALQISLYVTFDFNFFARKHLVINKCILNKEIIFSLRHKVSMKSCFLKMYLYEKVNLIVTIGNFWNYF